MGLLKELIVVYNIPRSWTNYVYEEKNRSFTLKWFYYKYYKCYISSIKNIINQRKLPVLGLTKIKLKVGSDQTLG